MLRVKGLEASVYWLQASDKGLLSKGSFLVQDLFLILWYFLGS